MIEYQLFYRWAWYASAPQLGCYNHRPSSGRDNSLLANVANERASPAPEFARRQPGECASQQVGNSALKAEASPLGLPFS